MAWPSCLDGTVRKQCFALAPLSLVVQPQSRTLRIVLIILFALVKMHEVYNNFLS